MISSGIKRGVAATAISALAVAGLPFLASTASATPIASTFADPADVDLYAPDGPNGNSAKNDGTNTTVSLLAGAGASVTSVLFQYSTDAGVSWVDVPGGNVARNPQTGVFGVDWAAPPVNTTNVRAVAGPGGQIDAAVVTVPSDATANTVELASKGSFGVFQEPYTNGGTYDATTSELLAVTGTVSEGSGAPTITDASHATGASDVAVIDAESTPATPASDTFQAVVDIDGYPYAGGTEGNQIALNAATSNTEDAEGSNLYVQTIGSITASPANQEDVSPSDSTAVLTVLDTTGKPVAGAEVFRGGDADDAGDDTDVDGTEERVGYTDGRGQIVADPAFGPEAGPGAAGTETYYVNVTNTDTREAGDPFTNVTVTTYTPVLTTVDIVNERNRSNFDRNEFSDSDDFSIETRDQRGNLFDENIAGADNDVEYRYIFNPDAAGAGTTSAWTGLETVGGEVAVPSPAGFGEGTYTLEARRPNVSGTGLINATPETFEGSDAAVTFDEGNAANAPVNGDSTLTGNLSNDDGGLGGREVELNYTPDGAGNADFAPQAAQPAGTDVVPDAGGPGSTVFAITDANGDFAVTLRDPAIPANVTPTEETGQLDVTDVDESATDTTSLGTTDTIDVFWMETPPVSSVTITTTEIVDNQFGPGRPVNVDVVVRGEDADTNPNNDPVLDDFPVSIEVDKGFLTPYAAGDNENNLDLDEENDDAGDLWGFFENLGADSDTSTGDNGAAQVAAAIERDAEFDNDGFVDVTITVTAGDVTESETLTADSRDAVNVVEADLPRDDATQTGDVDIDEDVDLGFEVRDQFGNLDGGQFGNVTDDSTVADFDTEFDFDSVGSDYSTSGPSITAFSNAPTVQTLMAMFTANEYLVTGDEDLDDDLRNVTADSDPINWVAEAGPTGGRIEIDVRLTGANNAGQPDGLKADAPRRAAGATVKLFRFLGDSKKELIRTDELNDRGNQRFKVRDLDGRDVTQYIVKVMRTEDTFKARSNRRKMR